MSSEAAGNMDIPRQPRSSSERPVIALSRRLIDTYREINRIYYEARSKRQADARQPPRQGTTNNGYDDDNFDYIIIPQELFANRYTLGKRIGKGSFGQVVSAYDNTDNCEVAIKIIKSKRPFFNQAQTEKELLTLIAQTNGTADHNLVELLDHFVYRDHQCLVFELLSSNLYDLLKNTKFRGVSLNLIRKFSRQILKALEFLAQPHIDIVHCDLKPENILLRHPRRSALKLIDFGSSCLASRTMYTYIQSRQTLFPHFT
jgi:dual specificity tyrosine-phosphorylation-regulated kinase 1